MITRKVLHVLKQYPPSLKLKVMGDGELRLEMTVAEMMCAMMTLPPYEHAIVFGQSDFILRERMDSSGGDAIVPQSKMWLELDVLS